MCDTDSECGVALTDEVHDLADRTWTGFGFVSSGRPPDEATSGASPDELLAVLQLSAAAKRTTKRAQHRERRNVSRALTGAPRSGSATDALAADDGHVALVREFVDGFSRLGHASSF